MIVLGLDPGTATTGYAVLQKEKGTLRCLVYGSVETPKRKNAGQRLLMLEQSLAKTLEKYKPDAAVVERLFFFKNLKSVMPVSEARGVLLLALARKKIPVFEMPPLQVKMAITGYGRADKKQVQKMVQKILALKEMPKPDDAADALALAIAWSSSAAT